MNNTNAMDLIFCRNVLMYFAPARAQLVGRRLFRSLVEGGWFIVSASELSQDTFAQFTPVHFPGAIVYRRTTEKAIVPAAAAQASPAAKENRAQG